jgi:hypothetical protein
VRAYLVDRLVTQAWTLAEVAAELRAAPTTVRRLLDQYGVRRVALTRRQRTAADAARGPKQQARAAQRRQARLAELGFAELDDYLRDRSVTRGWSVRRLGAELGVAMAGWTGRCAGSDGEPDLVSTDDPVRLPVGLEMPVRCNVSVYAVRHRKLRCPLHDRMAGVLD